MSNKLVNFYLWQYDNHTKLQNNFFNSEQTDFDKYCHKVYDMKKEESKEMIYKNEPSKKFRRSKTNFTSFGDIPRNPNSKRCWKKQKLYLCPGCFVKRSEFEGIDCKYCKAQNTRSHKYGSEVEDEE